MRNSVIALMVMLPMVGGLAQTKPTSKLKPPAKDYSVEIAQCEKSVAVYNRTLAEENQQQADLLRAAQSRVLTAKELKQLIDFDINIFIVFSGEYCDQQGDVISSFSGAYNDKELRTRFLNLLVEQELLRSLEK